MTKKEYTSRRDIPNFRTFADMSHPEKDQRTQLQKGYSPAPMNYDLGPREIPVHPDDADAAERKVYQRKLGRERIRKILDRLKAGG